MQVITNPNKTIPNINEDKESEFVVNVEKDNDGALKYFYIMVQYAGGSSYEHYFLWKGSCFEIPGESTIQLWSPVEKSKIKVLQRSYKFHYDHFNTSQEFYIINNMGDLLKLIKETIPYNNEVVHEISHESGSTRGDKFIFANIKNARKNFLYLLVPGDTLQCAYSYTWKGGSLYDDIVELDIEEISPKALMDYTYKRFYKDYDVRFYSIDDMKYLPFFARLMGV
jgi:hypothetical protein